MAVSRQTTAPASTAPASMDGQQVSSADGTVWIVIALVAVAIVVIGGLIAAKQGGCGCGCDTKDGDGDEQVDGYNLNLAMANATFNRTGVTDHTDGDLYRSLPATATTSAEHHWSDGSDRTTTTTTTKATAMPTYNEIDDVAPTAHGENVYVEPVPVGQDQDADLQATGTGDYDNMAAPRVVVVNNAYSMEATHTETMPGAGSMYELAAPAQSQSQPNDGAALYQVASAANNDDDIDL